MMSSAMDTVTEAQTAIAMALMGGIGVLHRNCTAEQQAKMVRRVKVSARGDLKPHHGQAVADIGEILQLIEETGITGFPVVDENGVLVRNVHRSRHSLCRHPQTRVGEIMSTPALSLPLSNRLEAEDFFRRYKLEKLPLVDAQGRLGGLITLTRLARIKTIPTLFATNKGSLMVAAAIGVGDEALERAAAQVEAGVDMLVVDSAHGHSDRCFAPFPPSSVAFPACFCRVATSPPPKGAIALAKRASDIVKVGMGPGSICTARVVSGVGVAQFSAVLRSHPRTAQRLSQVAIVADGASAIRATSPRRSPRGADAVMIGGLFCRYRRSPRRAFSFRSIYKTYRGMGSLAAMRKAGRDRYGQRQRHRSLKLVPRRRQTRVPYRGPLGSVVSQLIGGLRSGMGLRRCSQRTTCATAPSSSHHRVWSA